MFWIVVAKSDWIFPFCYYFGGLKLIVIVILLKDGTPYGLSFRLSFQNNIILLHVQQKAQILQRARHLLDPLRVVARMIGTNQLCIGLILKQNTLYFGIIHFALIV